jgi:RES domain-containing protein
MIYASEHYSTTLLEMLAHGSGELPNNQHYIEITIPNGTSYEVLDPAHLPGWDQADAAVSKPHGEKWQQERRSLILIVPSVIARIDNNILINPDHPDFDRVPHSLHKPVWWDRRLFVPQP